MPGLTDFIEQLSGRGSMDPQQAGQYADRFASNRPEDQEFNNQAFHRGASEYMGQMPEDQFHQAAQNAFNNATPDQRQGLLSHLIGALAGGGGLGALASQLGLQSTNPQQMGATDYSRLANYARTNQPDVLQNHVQSQPWLVKAMGHPVLMGALGLVAAKMAAGMFRRAA